MADSLGRDLWIAFAPFLGGALGSYLYARLKKEAEIDAVSHKLAEVMRNAFATARANEEGKIEANSAKLDLVVQQMKATTHAAEEIKLQLSGGLWEKQQRWRARFDTYVELLEAIAKTQVLFDPFQRVLAAPQKVDGADDLARMYLDSLLHLSSKVAKASLILPTSLREEWLKALGSMADGSNAVRVVALLRTMSNQAVEFGKQDLGL